jgi:putative membrane protein
MIRLIFVGVLLLLSLAFFLQNQEQEVTLRYFFGLFEASTPIYKPILAGFAMGLLVSGILFFPPWVKNRLELRRKTKALQEAEVDLERLRLSLDTATGRRCLTLDAATPRNQARLSRCHSVVPRR